MSSRRRPGPNQGGDTKWGPGLRRDDTRTIKFITLPCASMDFPTFLIQCLNAVQYGLLLFLVASGLTLIFGIMGVINLAHGSFYMLGAYLAYGLAPLVDRYLG